MDQSKFRPIHACDDYSHRFTIVPVDTFSLVGAKLWFTIKEDSTQTDSAAKLQYDSETPGGAPNIEITGALEFTIHLRDTDTAGLEGIWPYDIKVRRGAAGAAINRLARGKIEFLPNLTREIT